MTDGPVSRVWIALGSNLGDRKAILQEAVLRLHREGLPANRCSHLYETSPELDRDEPAYLNAVLESQSVLDPRKILESLLRIETELGRDPGDRSGSRTCDLDLLAVGNLVLTRAELTLPHPRLRERAFVLVPLCEIDPCWSLPGSNETAADLLGALVYRSHEVRVHGRLVDPVRAEVDCEMTGPDPNQSSRKET